MVDYCTATEIKDHLIDSQLDNTYDTILATLATRASRAIDRFTKRPAGAYAVTVDSTRYFDGVDCPDLLVDELAAAPTSVSVAESGDVDNSAGTGGTYTLWSADDYLLWPYNAPGLGLPYEALIIDRMYGTKSVWYTYRKGVKIVGKFGYSQTPPEEIKEATIMQAIKWFKRGQQALMDTSANPTFQQMPYGVVTVERLDPDIQLLLQHFVRVVV